MGDNTNIEWSDATWNPITGCTKVGPGCDNCYAEFIADVRLKGTKAFPNGFDLTFRPHLMDQPRRWRRGRKIFVNSMSDLFHKDVVNPPPNGAIPPGTLDRIFEEMEHCRHHTFQVLTKRASLMQKYINRRYKGGTCPAHIWLGVSVETRQQRGRLEHLRKTNCAVRFVSFEPLLAPMGPVDMSGIAWAIVGGESGPKARPMKKRWVCDLKRECAGQHVAFFFKQWGGRRKAAPDDMFIDDNSGGRNILDGKTHLDFPLEASRAALSRELAL